MTTILSSSSRSEVYHRPVTATRTCSTSAKIAALKLASCLTEPICKVREYFYTFYVLDEICDSTCEKIGKVVLLSLGILVYGLLAPVTAPFGAALRGLVSNMSDKPFLYVVREGEGKTLPTDHKIKIVSHNECYIPGGYCITDGQVTPASDKQRMDANLKLIQEKDPDIVCLYEVQDIYDAEYISSKLSDYPFIIPVAGMRAIGPSSMMYVASKYEILQDSIQFTPFVKGAEITGRAQGSEKGILFFSIVNPGSEDPIATIISTHLQHSEVPAKPTTEDKSSRSLQMAKINALITTTLHPVIIVGDLNQEESELKLDPQIFKRDSTVQGKPTWGGDGWCAALCNKEASKPLVLDYAYVKGAKDISTEIVETGYREGEFQRMATSDHYLLCTTIAIS